MGNQYTEQYYLERRLFGDDYVEALFDESEGEERNGRIQSISEICAESHHGHQETEKIKRIHFKGRGKTERPTCPTCGEDLKRSYEAVKQESGKWVKIPYGRHCKKCKYQTFD